MLPFFSRDAKAWVQRGLCEKVDSVSKRFELTVVFKLSVAISLNRVEKKCTNFFDALGNLFPPWCCCIFHRNYSPFLR